MCREAYPDVSPDCMYEVESLYDQCEPDLDYCGRLRWNFQTVFTTVLVWRFIRGDVFLPLKDTDYAECGKPLFFAC